MGLCALRGAAIRPPAPHPPTAHGAGRRPGCQHRPEAANTAPHGAAEPGFAERRRQAGRQREQSHPRSADDTWRLLPLRDQRAHGRGLPRELLPGHGAGTGLAAAGSPRSGERSGHRRGLSPAGQHRGLCSGGQRAEPGRALRWAGALRHKGGGEPPTALPGARQERPRFRGPP